MHEVCDCFLPMGMLVLLITSENNNCLATDVQIGGTYFRHINMTPVYQSLSRNVERKSKKKVS